jgi:hypothetical protein
LDNRGLVSICAGGVSIWLTAEECLLFFFFNDTATTEIYTKINLLADAEEQPSTDRWKTQRPK